MPFTRFPHGVSSLGVPVVPDISAGIGLGDIYWVVTSKTSSDIFYEKLRTKVSDDTIFASLQAAHDACTTGQGDTIFVAPGLYTVTAKLIWTKNNCQVVGLTGPNNLLSVAAAGAATRDFHTATFYTTTAAVVDVMQVKGCYNQFYNLGFINAGAAATNLTAVYVGGFLSNSYGHNNYFNRCTFHGCMSTSQNSIRAASLNIGSGASNYMFEDCIIGQNTFGGAKEVAYQGHLLYGGSNECVARGDETAGVGGYGPQNGLFKGCRFFSRTATATTVPMVSVGGAAAPSAAEQIDRDHIFENCIFATWGGATEKQVFDLNISGGPGRILIKDCAAYGYDEWREPRGGQVGDTTNVFWVNMPVSNVAEPGIGVQPTS